MDRELSDTLFDLVGSLYQSDETVPLSVESVEIVAPVVVRLVPGEDGPRLLAAPPGTAFRTGFEPIVQPLRVTAVGTSSTDWPPIDPESEDAGSR